MSAESTGQQEPIRRTPPPRTVIDFVDIQPPEQALAHRMREVHINGVPVLVAKDGIDLEFSESDVTSVTLRLLPTEVHFISKPPAQE